MPGKKFLGGWSSCFLVWALVNTGVFPLWLFTELYAWWGTFLSGCYTSVRSLNHCLQTLSNLIHTVWGKCPVWVSSATATAVTGATRIMSNTDWVITRTTRYARNTTNSSLNSNKFPLKELVLSFPIWRNRKMRLRELSKFKASYYTGKSGRQGDSKAHGLNAWLAEWERGSFYKCRRCVRPTNFHFFPWSWPFYWV